MPSGSTSTASWGHTLKSALRDQVLTSVIIGFPSTASSPQLRVVHTPCSVLADASPFSLLPPHPGLPSVQVDTQEGDTDYWSHDAGRSHMPSLLPFLASWDDEGSSMAGPDKSHCFSLLRSPPRVAPSLSPTSSSPSTMKAWQQ